MFTLKPPFETNCFQCQKKLTVNFCPPLQQYSNKNNWGYWTGQKKNEDKYICNACLIDMYRNHRLAYLDFITDSKKRRTFRAYFGGKVSSPLLTKTQQKQLEKSELHNILERKGINLDEDGLGNYIESWRQIVFKLVQENSLQTKKNQRVGKNDWKKKKKKKKKRKFNGQTVHV